LGLEFFGYKFDFAKKSFTTTPSLSYNLAYYGEQ